MDNDIVLQVENVSKEFAMPSSQNEQNESFFALKNVSFQVKRGEVLSIIGNNGSGKTTLLKILSGITKPTSGEVRLYGSSTSILDIGNNFHPDLSGRENVELQLKLSKRSKEQRELSSQQILDFSEIGQFYDQPVKHYSSGMFLRLAFSLAFHVATDILILDEVLSVGDEGFRLKCQELLKTFTTSGKTIIFVSHNRMELLELSKHCLWIEKGEIKKTGLTTAVLGEYFARHKDNFDGKKEIIDIDQQTLDENNKKGTITLAWDEANAPKNEYVAIRALNVSNGSGAHQILSSDPINVSFLLEKKLVGIKIGISFFVQDVFYQSVMVGHLLNNTEKKDLSVAFMNFKGLVRINCSIPADFLLPGKYYLHLRFGVEENEWNPESRELLRFSERLSFIVHPSNDYSDLIGDITKGSVRPRLEWKIEEA